ncbi:STM3941 family protein [Clostridium sp.]|uniref:STM3941 family protein n=1 Tax=Clostridium sp. TaxID=1506 RepID=UPI003D6CC599
MNEVIIKQTKKKVIQLIILDILILIVSVYVLAMSIINVEILFIIVGIIGTVFFGVCFIFIVKSVICKTPLLLIGNEGITDMSTVTSVGFIAWGEIESISVKNSTQRFIAVTVYNPIEIKKRISLLKRVAMKSNTILHIPPVLILLNIVDIEFNEALSLMQKKLEEYRTNLN